jgi:hypothetical protein
VGFIKKDFHPERSAMNAYVVFKARESAEAALAANGSLLDGKHITCDIAANKVRGWLVDRFRAAVFSWTGLRTNFGPIVTTVNMHGSKPRNLCALATARGRGLSAECTKLGETLSSPQEHDTRHTVFVGGLPFNTEDEALREHFGQCGAIHSVRVIRDKRTGIGKGIAYVRFMVWDADGPRALRTSGKYAFRLVQVTNLAGLRIAVE